MQLHREIDDACFGDRQLRDSVVALEDQVRKLFFEPTVSGALDEYLLPGGLRDCLMLVCFNPSLDFLGENGEALTA